MRGTSMNSTSDLAGSITSLRESKPLPVARASTIRQSIAAAERRLLELDDARDRAQQRELIEQLRHALRLAR